MEFTKKDSGQNTSLGQITVKISMELNKGRISPRGSEQGVAGC